MFMRICCWKSHLLPPVPALGGWSIADAALFQKKQYYAPTKAFKKPVKKFLTPTYYYYLLPKFCGKYFAITYVVNLAGTLGLLGDDIFWLGFACCCYHQLLPTKLVIRKKVLCQSTLIIDGLCFLPNTQSPIKSSPNGDQSLGMKVEVDSRIT